MTNEEKLIWMIKSLTSAFINHNYLLAISKTVTVSMVAGAITLGYVTAQLIAELIYRRKHRAKI
jgi:uncharacterized membrane protein YjjB (DUF3815 family)